MVKFYRRMKDHAREIFFSRPQRQPLATVSHIDVYMLNYVVHELNWITVVTYR